MDIVKSNNTNGKYTKVHINEVNHIQCCYITISYTIVYNNML